MARRSVLVVALCALLVAGASAHLLDRLSLQAQLPFASLIESSSVCYSENDAFAMNSVNAYGPTTSMEPADMDTPLFLQMDQVSSLSSGGSLSAAVSSALNQPTSAGSASSGSLSSVVSSASAAPAGSSSSGSGSGKGCPPGKTCCRTSKGCLQLCEHDNGVCCAQSDFCCPTGAACVIKASGTVHCKAGAGGAFGSGSGSGSNPLSGSAAGAVGGLGGAGGVGGAPGMGGAGGLGAGAGAGAGGLGGAGGFGSGAGGNGPFPGASSGSLAPGGAPGGAGSGSNGGSAIRNSKAKSVNVVNHIIIDTHQKINLGAATVGSGSGAVPPAPPAGALSQSIPAPPANPAGSGSSFSGSTESGSLRPVPRVVV